MKRPEGPALGYASNVTPETIQSSKNPIVKRVRAVREGRDPDLLCAEGVRLVEEALDAGLEVDCSLVSRKLYTSERGKALAQRLAQVSRDTRDCSDEVLARASILTTHQGVLALCKRPRWKPSDLVRGARPFFAAAIGVRDPGNLGALVRSAEAAGASGFLSLHNSADPWKDKALRGSAGSIFRLPSVHGLPMEDFGAFCTKHDVALVATDSKQGSSLWELDFGDRPVAFLLGAEAAGLPKVIAERCERRLRIPMAQPVESLNVSVAGSLVLFEMRRRMLELGSGQG